jgi:hypothetical protein
MRRGYCHHICQKAAWLPQSPSQFPTTLQPPVSSHLSPAHAADGWAGFSEMWCICYQLVEQTQWQPPLGSSLSWWLSFLAGDGEEDVNGPGTPAFSSLTTVTANSPGWVKGQKCWRLKWALLCTTGECFHICCISLCIWILPQPQQLRPPTGKHWHGRDEIRREIGTCII